MVDLRLLVYVAVILLGSVGTVHGYVTGDIIQSLVFFTAAIIWSILLVFRLRRVLWI